MKRTISKSKIKVYWRSKLYHLLRMPAILRGIFLTEEGQLEFLVSDWKSYWSEVQPDCIYIAGPRFIFSNTFLNDIRPLKALYSCTIQKIK